MQNYKYLSFFSQIFLFPKHYADLQLSWVFDMKEAQHLHKTRTICISLEVMYISYTLPKISQSSYCCTCLWLFHTDLKGVKMQRPMYVHPQVLPNISILVLVYCSLFLAFFILAQFLADKNICGIWLSFTFIVSHHSALSSYWLLWAVSHRVVCFFENFSWKRLERWVLAGAVSAPLETIPKMVSKY